MVNDGCNEVIVYFCEGMRVLMSILLMLLLGWQCLAKVGIVAWYELNKEYVAKYLCENKNKPELKCCGKCYLQKKLNKVTDVQSTSPKAPNKTEKYEVSECVLPEPVTLAEYKCSVRVSDYNGSKKDFYFSIFSSSIFHPPSVG